MKRKLLLISTLCFLSTLFISRGYTQGYVHYATFAGYSYFTQTVLFSPDSRTLATSGGWKKNVLLWDTKTGVPLRALAGFESAVISLSFSPDGRTLACGDLGGTVLLFDTATGELKKNLSDFITDSILGNPNSLSFSPDGRTLLVGTYGPIMLFNAITGKYEKMLFGHDGDVLCMSFSPKGTRHREK